MMSVCACKCSSDDEADEQEDGDEDTAQKGSKVRKIGRKKSGKRRK
jgi:hypothetical protein